MSAFLERSAQNLWDQVQRLQQENRELRAKLDNRKKLDEETVAEIRRFGRTAGLTDQELADMYSVNRSTISRIRRRIYHKDVA